MALTERLGGSANRWRLKACFAFHADAEASFAPDAR